MNLNLFAGAGGWDEGGKALGIKMVGAEIERDACQTATLAGHQRMMTDVLELDPRVPLQGLVASPPCKDFSITGNQPGLDGPTGSLMNEILRFAKHGKPEWIACEQVPPALPLFKEYAAVLREWGYSAWSGLCNSWDFGVPQSRTRAFLIASRERPVMPPIPTHAAGEVSMGSALGWTDDMLDEWVYGKAAGSRWFMHPVLSNKRQKFRTLDQLSPTLALGRDAGYGWHWCNNLDRYPLQVEHLAVLQGFRADYPFSGARMRRFRMPGETVPPPLAQAVLAAATGLALPEME